MTGYLLRNHYADAIYVWEVEIVSITPNKGKFPHYKQVKELVRFKKIKPIWWEQGSNEPIHLIFDKGAIFLVDREKIALNKEELSEKLKIRIKDRIRSLKESKQILRTSIEKSKQDIKTFEASLIDVCNTKKTLEEIDTTDIIK